MGLLQDSKGYIVATIVGSIKGITSVGIVTYLSKIVEMEEYGKVFSLIAALDSTIPTIGDLLFTYVFNSSINYFPGLIFIISALMLFIPLFILIWVIIKYKNSLNS